MTADDQVRGLLRKWIAAWNDQKADVMKELMTTDCNMIGFDGSQMTGRDEICEAMAKIFAHHPTGLFVVLIREVRILAPGVALLRADSGMVPRGYSEVNPAINATQTVVAVEKEGPQGKHWQMSLFQNTPAAYHGHPELSAKLTEELQKEFSRSETSH